MMRFPLFVMLFAAVIPLTAQAQTTVRVAITQHNALPAQLSDATADQLLAAMSSLLQIGDSNSDVACPVTFARVGPVGTFTSAEIPFSIASEQAFENTINQGNSIKIVGEILWCGSLLPGIAGCADVGGPRMVVTRRSSSIEAVIWAHEFGHTTGSSHRDIPLQLMRPSAIPDMREVNSIECQRKLTVNHLAPGPQAITIDENVGPPLAQLMDAEPGGVGPQAVEDFVRDVKIDGVSYLEASRFGAEHIPFLVGVLADETQKETWSNVVSALGAIGDETAVIALLEFLRSDPDATLDVVATMAKADVLIALGWAAAKDETGPALQTLLSGTDGDWWAETMGINWKTPVYASREDLIQSLVTRSIVGLTLSGSTAARIRLEQLGTQTRDPGATAAPFERSAIEELAPGAIFIFDRLSPSTQMTLQLNGGEAYISDQLSEFDRIDQLGLIEYYSN